MQGNKVKPDSIVQSKVTSPKSGLIEIEEIKEPKGIVDSAFYLQMRNPLKKEAKDPNNGQETISKPALFGAKADPEKVLKIVTHVPGEEPIKPPQKLSAKQ